MATGEHGAVLSNRWLALVPGLAALACALIIIYIVLQIDQTRKQLQDDGVLEFNFIQQVDHNFDALAQTLMIYILGEDAQRPSLKSAYIQRYDVLYGSIRYVSSSWLGNLTNFQTTHDFFVDANNYLDKYEPLMSLDRELESGQALQMNKEALSLSAQVYDIGLEMFERKSVTRENISLRMDELYSALWMFGLFFLFTLLMTIALLVTMYRRAAGLQAAAVSTRTQLSTALDELTTGDIERQAQNRFMAAASHDLRQPLHALGLYLSSLKRHIPSEEGRVILASTHRSTEALKQLLDSMLDLSKLDAGVVDVNRENLSLDSIFDNLQQRFLPEARQRQLELDIEFSKLAVNSDRLLLERVLGNLVANALNYTQAGCVTIKAEADEANVRISISDTGPGIPLSEQEAIFNEYYQLQNPERDRTKGLGLGLSIVKRLSWLLNIDLKIISDEGQGSTFQILLPKSASIDIDHQDYSACETGTPSANDLTGLSILIIDDEQEVRNGMRTLLVQHNCEVVLAESTDEALQHIVDHSWIPDLVIADYRLRDEQTGDTAIERVREEVNADVPAMIITGDTSPERLREATDSGFYLLHKPVIIPDLLAAIDELVARSDMRCDFRESVCLPD